VHAHRELTPFGVAGVDQPLEQLPSPQLIGALVGDVAQQERHGVARQRDRVTCVHP
jgi:hypothetical protein